MKRLILTAIAAVALTACTHSDTDARHAVEAQGLKNVTLDGWAMFGCGEDDAFHTKFHATAVNGARVTGVVCGGLLKGNTVRITD